MTSVARWYHFHMRWPCPRIARAEYPKWQKLCATKPRTVGIISKPSNSGKKLLIIICQLCSSVTEIIRPMLSLKKYAPRLPPAQNSHETVTFPGCIGRFYITSVLAPLQFENFVCSRIHSFKNGWHRWKLRSVTLPREHIQWTYIIAVVVWYNSWISEFFLMADGPCDHTKFTYSWSASIQVLVSDDWFNDYWLSVRSAQYVT